MRLRRGFHCRKALSAPRKRLSGLISHVGIQPRRHTARRSSSRRAIRTLRSKPSALESIIRKRFLRNIQQRNIAVFILRPVGRRHAAAIPGAIRSARPDTPWLYRKRRHAAARCHLVG